MTQWHDIVCYPIPLFDFAVVFYPIYPTHPIPSPASQSPSPQLHTLLLPLDARTVGALGQPPRHVSIWVCCRSKETLLGQLTSYASLSTRYGRWAPSRKWKHSWWRAFRRSILRHLCLTRRSLALPLQRLASSRSPSTWRKCSKYSNTREEVRPKLRLIATRTCCDPHPFFLAPILLYTLLLINSFTAALRHVLPYHVLPYHVLSYHVLSSLLRVSGRATGVCEWCSPGWRLDARLPPRSRTGWQLLTRPLHYLMLRWVMSRHVMSYPFIFCHITFRQSCPLISWPLAHSTILCWYWHPLSLSLTLLLSVPSIDRSLFISFHLIWSLLILSYLVWSGLAGSEQRARGCIRAVQRAAEQQERCRDRWLNPFLPSWLTLWLSLSSSSSPLFVHVSSRLLSFDDVPRMTICIFLEYYCFSLRQHAVTYSLLSLLLLLISACQLCRSMRRWGSPRQRRYAGE